jgi:hypothetical protein
MFAAICRLLIGLLLVAIGAVGIDLGTTYSYAWVLSNSRSDLFCL